jgi:chemotaxis protein histidine kinase CheA
LDPELAQLIPLFVEEVRDRLDHLATLAPQLGRDDGEDGEAKVLVKRELHTVKGAARMLQLGQVAELCHAAEEMVESPPADLVPLLVRAVDRLSAMVDDVAAGEAPEPATDLLRLLTESSEAAPETEPAGPRAGREMSPEPPAAPDDAPGPAGSADQVAVGVADVTAAEALGRSGLGRDDGLGDEGLGDDTADDDTRKATTAGDVRVDASSLDAVADQTTQVRILALATRTSIERIYDLAKLAEDGLREPQPTQVLAVLATMLRRLAVDVESSQRRLLRSSEDSLERLLKLQLQPLRSYLVQMARYARELARSLGREVEVELEGEETRLDRRIARELEESLLHLVRNSVDHGIEAPDVRRAAGKSPVGKIKLSAEAASGRVRLVIQDDGAGIDPDAVVRQAVRSGLVDQALADSVTREEAYRLLFTPGFSTRRKVSEISGRGVGLDVVAGAVNRVGGEVFLSAEPGKGSTVVVEVPLARRGEQVLLVKVGQARLALPSAPIRQSERFDTADVLERDGRSFLKLDGKLVPFVPLSEVFGQVPGERQMLLRGRVSGQPLALAVDEVEGEQEVLVRPITRTVAVEPALDGVALLPSGQPIGVLSPSVLAKRDFLRTKGRVAPMEMDVRRVRILLVDDSLVTREMERRLLEDAGFQVTAAGDAEEGLNYLGEEEFDCLVTDIEMPGMDGFEFTAHLRSIPQFSQLPIIVVSTRDRPEDRLNGLRSGADAYLTKQSLDAGELVDLVRRLSGIR